jgi:putative tryptophan/tyrosine transport system substrate-binding protein
MAYRLFLSTAATETRARACGSLRRGTPPTCAIARRSGRISLLATELSAKRLEILREIVPRAARVAMLWNDTNPGMVLRAQEAREAAPKLGVTVQSIRVHDLVDFGAAFAAIESWHADALLTLVDPFTRQHRKRIAEFATQRRLPGDL